MKEVMVNRTDSRLNGYSDALTNGRQMDRQSDEQTDSRMDGRTDSWVVGCPGECTKLGNRLFLC